MYAIRSYYGIENAGEGELVILCCCAPAYEHDDTVLLTQDDS